VILLSNSFSLLLANFYGFKGELFYYGVNLDIKEWQWADDFVFLIFFFGSCFPLLLGLIAEKKYRKIKRNSCQYKLYFF